jgi:chromosome segregation ATPase
MTTALLATERPVDREEADELRHELERLQTAISSLENAVAEANRARTAAENDLSAHRVLLDDALELRAALEHRVSELEHELLLERTTSSIRAKLLADIMTVGFWRRRKAIARAIRVERLLVRR